MLKKDHYGVKKIVTNKKEGVSRPNAEFRSIYDSNTQNPQ